MLSFLIEVWVTSGGGREYNETNVRKNKMTKMSLGM
jgi:hypothetical protein